jgi:flagellar biosynthesis/type III secretory pathway chaperone|tara:strand:+ start:1113 stop:1553 length:441 start_codon:yes stop_codon:yes gene_type:complete
VKISDIPYLQQILHKTEALRELLEKEFSALSKKDLPELEEIQQKKSEILASLSNEKFLSLVEFQKASGNRSDFDEEPLRIWDKIIAVMQDNRKLHQRNEVLVNTKLESIRNAIKTLGTNDPQSSVEIYDKLGKIKGSKFRNKMGDA